MILLPAPIAIGYSAQSAWQQRGGVQHTAYSAVLNQRVVEECQGGQK